MKELTASLLEKANKMAGTALAAYKSTGIQYALMKGDEIILSGSNGVYDKTESRPLNKNTMYGIGSISKVFVTSAAMLLSDKKKLDIDEPVKTYLPDFEMADARYTGITPRHLMNHSSGIYGSHYKGAFLFEDSDTYAHDNLLANLKTGTLKFNPGAFSEYCNDGFTLLEILVERLSDMKYNEYLQKFFFEPLGIKNTKTPVDNFDRTQLARACMSMYDGTLPFEATNLIGTGGIYSTAEDLCKLAIVFTGKKILSLESAKAMAQKEYEKGIWPIDEEGVSIFSYGLGWDNVHLPPFSKYGIKAHYKGGNTIQYHSAFVCIPEHDLAAAVLSSGSSSLYQLSFAIEILLDSLKGFGIIKERKPETAFTAPVKKEMPAELLGFSGVYAENGKFVEVKIKDGEFELPMIFGGLIPKQNYIYSGDGLFKNPDGSTAVRFIKKAEDLIFLQTDLYFTFPEIGSIAWNCFQYQKLHDNPIAEKIASSWEKRKDKKYLLINEKFTSQGYLSFTSSTRIELPVNTQIGYAYGGCRIINENHAKNELYFRDVTDLQFHTEGDTEYLYAGGMVFINKDCIPYLEDTKKTLKIAENGYTIFYLVDKSCTGKTISVQCPKTGAFGLYNEKMEFKNLTTVTGKNSAELTEGDLIAFIGSPGDEFRLELR